MPQFPSLKNGNDSFKFFGIVVRISVDICKAIEQWHLVSTTYVVVALPVVTITTKIMILNNHLLKVDSQEVDCCVTSILVIVTVVIVIVVTNTATTVTTITFL